MNHPLTAEQKLQIQAEESRKLHDRLARYEAELNELDDNPFRYTVAEVNERRAAILRNRAETRKVIEEMQK